MSQVLEFWASVDKHGPIHPTLGTRCWLWKGHKLKGGYGKLGRAMTHRLSYELNVGTIPFGISVLHKCDVRHCANPNHLFLGTQQDNLKDMRNKDRQVRGEDQGLSKLTEDQVRIIRQRYRRYSHQHGTGALAREFGVAHVTIYRVVMNTRWRHVV